MKASFRLLSRGTPRAHFVTPSSSLSSLLSGHHHHYHHHHHPTATLHSPFSSDASDDSSAFVTVSIEEARSKATAALRKIGWDEHDAALQADIMTAAELGGNNQGLVKLVNPRMMAPAADAGKPIIERETLSSAVINGNQAPGMLAAVTAADLAVSKVLPTDDEKNKDKDGTSTPPPPPPLAVSIVSTYNTSTSSGQLAYYVRRMAEKGLIGVALCNSPEFVAAEAGGKPVFGTNPLAVAVPTSSDGTEVFSFDMATSAIALFGVLTSQSKGEPLPPNVAYDRDGNWTTDASKVMQGGGAIATFGGYKGAGLSLCVELLAAGLSGAAVLGQVESKKTAKSWGHTFVAIRPEMLVDDFPKRAASIIATVKASGDSVRIPGERSAAIAAERTAAGVMPIPRAIWESICRTAEHGLPDEA